MDGQIIPWDEGRKRVHARGFQMPYVNPAVGARQLAMHLSCIEPGLAAHDPHSHAGEEIIFVLEGEAEITLGSERHVVGPNTAIFCPEHAYHGIRNCGDRPLRYLILRATPG